ncbi:uncharacterized protein [Palaemon carinicauda]|uniref:uncharacterized protein n=1 Tax=Palaemon carinicauda TaxID=392227 RepID=UPI0035B5FF00
MWVYNALEEGVAQDYQKVKAIILKSYDLVPEVYRLRFRNYTKHPAESFVVFARVKEEQFDDCHKSRHISTFATLWELLLLEEFQEACSRELRVYWRQKVIGIWVESKEVPTPPKSFANKDFPGWGNSRYNRNRSAGRKGSCFLCNRPGHYQNQCNTRRIYLERNNQSPVTLVSDKSEGKFFRDTSSARSLVLRRALNSSEKYTGNFVVLGFPDSVVTAPLLNGLMSFPGYDRVPELAVVDSLPILDIDGILGNAMLIVERRELFSMLSVNVSLMAIMTQPAAKAANLPDVDSDDD